MVDSRDPNDPNEASEPNDARDPNEQQEPYIYAQPKSGFSLMGSQNDDGEEDGEPVSPEEQAQYNNIVVNAMSMMYSNPDMAGMIARRLKSEAENFGIANAIGQQTANIMLSVVRAMKKTGEEPDPDVVQNAGMEIFAEVFEIAERTGQVPRGQEDKIKQDAVYEGTRYYGDKMLKSGEITPEMQQQARQAVEQDVARSQQQPQQAPQPPQPGAQ